MKKSEESSSELSKYDIEVEGVYLDDGSLRYPELISHEKIDFLKSQMSEVFFACQYLNNPLPEGIRIFVKEKLFFIREDQYDIREGTNYCFFDPSQGKKFSDFPANIFVNHYHGRLIIFDAVDDKIPLATLIPMLSAKLVDTMTRSWIFETNGTTLLEETFYKELERLNYKCYLEGIHETRNKEERIGAMQPELYNGTVFFREDFKKAYPELMNQVLFYPAWGHDDFPDVIEKAISYVLHNQIGSFVSSGSAGSSDHKTFAGSLGDKKGSW